MKIQDAEIFQITQSEVSIDVWGKPSLVWDVEDFRLFMKFTISQGEKVSSTPSSSSEQLAEVKTSSKCCMLKISTKKLLNPFTTSATELKQLSPRSIIWGRVWQEKERRSLKFSEIKWVLEPWSKVILPNSTESSKSFCELFTVVKLD